MAVYAPKVKIEGSSSKPITVAGGAHIFSRSYYRSRVASGDVRAHYEDLEFTSTGSGETFRIRAIANGTGVATGGTVNAIHATARIASGGSISGAMSAIRATIEDANTSGTQGGTLAALQVDSNISHDTTVGANTAFIRVSNSGAHKITNLFNIEEARATTDATALVSTNHDAATIDTYIKCRINGATYWLAATSHTIAGS